MAAAFAVGQPGVAAAAEPPSASCQRDLTANVVALNQTVQFNRYGAHHPAWMIYALRRDVVGMDGGQTLTAGSVRLREGKRPRPLVLRMNVGDCLTISFQNLLEPSPDPSDDQPATRKAGIHVTGLNYVQGMQDDGANVGGNASSLVDTGGTATYKLRATVEGVFPFYNQGVTTGGEANLGSIAFGMFGVVVVEPPGAEWYRSQVTRADLDLATTGILGGAPAGHPQINYDAAYPAGHPLDGRPILRMLTDANEIVHGDISAIVTGPGRGRFPAGTFAANPVLEPNSGTEPGPDAGTRDRRDPFREYVAVFHDELKTIQAFEQFEDSVLGHTLHGVRDAFAVNYGTAGAGSAVLANRFGLGPSANCAECKYEEFFLTSWVGGDPALLVDRPANAGGAAPDPTQRATRALFPDDPANVFHSYLGDRTRLRNAALGGEQHIFHLHAHQWTINPDESRATYLDSQLIGPGSGRTYEITFNGAGNRNSTVGDSIFHCHLYPHFAQGMWALWRVHDVFERGTELDSEGRAASPLHGFATGSRAYPDGEILEGVAIPAVVPIPTMPMAPLPADVRIGEDGQVVLASLPADDGTPMETWDEARLRQWAAQNPGYPFFIPARAGRRPPRGPLDTIDDGGLPRHVVLDGEAVPLDASGNPVAPNGLLAAMRLSMDKRSERLNVQWLNEGGEPAERAAMAFHALRTHPSLTPQGAPRAFVTNGRPPVRGAPYADPCVTDTGTPSPGAQRTYKAAAFQTRLFINRAGWHFPQARMLALWEDVLPTINRTRPPEPMAIRANSGECIEYHHTNLIPPVYELDDYQVRTPTDIIGQHIHLVKFDVTTADGSGNGWNYEDGTLSPGDVRERIEAIRRNNACAEGATGQNCPLAVPHPFFGAGTNNEWLGAQTTVQRWYADPFLDQNNTDRTLRTVYTHDHFGPSTHQQNGLYAALIIEPAGSRWEHPERNEVFGTRSTDGGPTGWAANIITSDPSRSYREFMLQVSDFAQAYEANRGIDSQGRPIPDPDRVINPPVRDRIGLPYLVRRARECPGGAPRPCPEAIAAADPGTNMLGYRNEPLALRLLDPNRPRPDGSGNGGQAAGMAGDPAFAFRSDIPRAMTQFNSQPNFYPPLVSGLEPGDPWTPMLRAYKRDRVYVRMMVGAHEEPHIANFLGLRWQFNDTDPNSGWRSSQHAGISEHFEFDTPLVPPEGDFGQRTDYFYSLSSSADGLWNGAWSLVRAYEFQRNDLRPLPNNVPPPRRTVTTPDGQPVEVSYTGRIQNLNEFTGVCPNTAPVRRYNVSAVSASVAAPGGRITYNSRAGAYSGQRGPIVDPTGAFYVLDSDLDATGRLKPGRSVEPLVLRARAGECIVVRLTNRLAPTWAAQVVQAANHGFYGLPMLVERFNANQVTPSMEVGLTPQLVATDVTRDGGANVGMNSTTRNRTMVVKQTALPGQSINYRWYAGLLEVTSDNRLRATPVEFGAANLLPTDRIRQGGKGLVGALVVLPENATWTEETGTRMAATVNYTDSNGAARTFRDFVVVFQDDVNLRASNRAVCPVGAGDGLEGPDGEPLSITTERNCPGLEDAQDSGNFGLNYRAEPFWFRLGHPPGENFGITNRLDYANVLANATAGGDPQTPVFTAKVGQEIRFRLTQPSGHDRPASFTLHGHNWAARPYAEGTVPSQRIEGVRWQNGFRPSPALGTREGMGPTNHFDIVVDRAGGPHGVTGDYLFRNLMPMGFDGGHWGILRVTP